MDRFAYLTCPDCGRKWSAHISQDSKETERICKDCAVMPGWHKNFDSPPRPEKYAELKAGVKNTGTKEDRERQQEQYNREHQRER